MRFWPRPTARRSAPQTASGRVADIKASATGLVALHLDGQARWTPRDYGALAREGYERNAIVYRCVRMIAEAAASVTWLAYERTREFDEHPLLALLSRPNGRQSGPELFEAWYGHLLVAGNAYLEAVSLGSQVREIYALRPDRMKVVPDADGWPVAFEYGANGRVVRFAAEGDPVQPIVHMALFHPTDDHYGMSPLEAAAIAVDIHNAASAWNKALLDNSARPSGALVYSGAGGVSHLGEDQFSRLKAELQDAYQGARNAGRPMLLEGGLDWKAMAMSPKEMDFIELKHVAAREIALAFGIPPMLLGIPGDNTFANYQEANRTFWRQTVLPLVAKTAKALTQWLGPAFGADVRLWYDADRIEALSAEREALWSRLSAADFLTEDEKRAAVGYGPKGAASPGRPEGAGA